MALQISDSATAANVAAATTQDGQIAALAAPWGAGDVQVRMMTGSTIAEVCTHGPWVPDALTPRGMSLGPIAASTVMVADAAITSVAFVLAGAVVFSAPVADIALDGATTKTGRRTSLADALRPKVRVIADGTLPLAATYLLTFAAADAATVNVAAVGSITNSGTGACAWSITPPSNVTVTPSSGTLAAGGTQALSITATVAGTYGLTLVSAGATITGSPQSIVVSGAAATALTVSVPSSGPAGTAVNVTVTPNGPIPPGGGTVTLATSAGTLGASTLTFTAGATAAQTTTLTLASAGSASVSMTNSMGLTNTGSPASFTATAPAGGYFSAVTNVSNDAYVPTADTGQTLIVSLHGSGTNYDAFFGAKWTADLAGGLEYAGNDTQFKFAIQSSNSGSIKQATVNPSDRQADLPSGGRRESQWMGWTDGPDVGVLNLYTERRLDAMLAWIEANYPQISTTKRVLTGGSMGAFGTLTYGLRRANKFAALYPDRPRWQSAPTAGTVWVPDWDVGVNATYTFAAAPLLRAEDGGYSSATHQDHLAWISNPANELPWIGWCIGRNDGGGPWADQLAAIAALQARGAAFAVFWNDGNHSGGARLYFEIVPTYPFSSWELGKGYPIFTEHSLDDDPTVDIEGGINIGLAFRNVVETSTTWSCEVRHQGTTFRPAQACTVRVKPKSWIYTGNPAPQLVALPAAGAWTSVSF